MKARHEVPGRQERAAPSRRGRLIRSLHRRRLESNHGQRDLGWKAEPYFSLGKVWDTPRRDLALQIEAANLVSRPNKSRSFSKGRKREDCFLLFYLIPQDIVLIVCLVSYIMGLFTNSHK
jgi:hypothetical protein